MPNHEKQTLLFWLIPFLTWLWVSKWEVFLLTRKKKANEARNSKYLKKSVKKIKNN